jgi:LDH2 family malate/lactate/ureidoglycolate dehydrogenase
MIHYLPQLRGSKPRAGQQVMAPGDREWATAEQRRKDGIPLDPITVSNFTELSETYNVPAPWANDR